MPRKIIIDANPSQTDAIALMMALSSPDDVAILGITIVGGLIPLPVASHNARRIVELSGVRDVPIFAGAAGPLRPIPQGVEVAVPDQTLDGFDSCNPSVQLEEEGAVDFIISTLRHCADRTVALCCFGPLTNIATAIAQAPDIVPRIREIVLTGGSHFEMGNISPVAECNMFVDPDAAQAVLNSGIPCVIMPLDVTHKVVVTPQRLAMFRAIGTEVGNAVAAWANLMERVYSETFGADGMPLHSPCVIAYMLRPYLFTGHHLNVAVEVDSLLTRGMTVVDLWGLTNRPPNALFMSNVDATGLFALLTERIARL
ncbi:nucleoside hydrolase [Falsirhodobacter halotolerans]|uniref:nucleoside hydrolase n=1 Tax=Falsirhodobacter halotolerans TaxID=1146892 RepID=UPI001FD2167A|nr:nucleoside hydrolase [Falsirhodobacter halotolerans]MCJ8139721.1 nucleoside hydrolase [Falsirhodobacter halotolerans]